VGGDTTAVELAQFYSLARSWDGLTLYAASSDGTLGVFDFDPEELEGISPHSVQEQYLQKFDFIPPPIPEGYSHSFPTHARDTSSMRITPPPSPLHSQDRATSSQSHTGFGHSVNGNGERVNMLVAKKKVKRKGVPNLAPLSASATADRTVGDFVYNVPASRSSLVPRANVSVVCLTT